MVAHNLSRDDSYHANLRNIVNTLEERHPLTRSPETFYGGGRVREFVATGNSSPYPAVQMLAEMASEGGTVGGSMSSIRADAIRGGKVNRLKKANRWLGFVDKGIGSIVRPITEPIAHALGQAGANKIMGGKVNRLKKANRWLGFVDKGIGSIVRPITEPIANALGQAGANKIMGYGGKMRKRRGGAHPDPVIQKAYEATELARLSANHPELLTSTKHYKSLMSAYNRAKRLHAMRGGQNAPIGRRSGAGLKEVVEKVKGAYSHIPKPIKDLAQKHAIQYVESKMRGRTPKKEGGRRSGGKRARSSSDEPKRGRGARAMIVKKVMAEKGLSMIEASKYVKAHGLY